jgi:hypothetical protein
MKKLAKWGAAASAVVMSTGAFAAVDATIFDGIEADLSTVGAGLIALAALAMGFKWVKAAFF